MTQGNAPSYGVVEGWEQLPRGYQHRDVAGVAVDSEDRVFLICRGDHPITIYDRRGKFLGGQRHDPVGRRLGHREGEGQRLYTPNPAVPLAWAMLGAPHASMAAPLAFGSMAVRFPRSLAR